MSPEQARGREVDPRTGVWALGCLLFELLTARAPFARSSLGDTVAAVLGEEPDWSALPPDARVEGGRKGRRSGGLTSTAQGSCAGRPMGRMRAAVFRG